MIYHRKCWLSLDGCRCVTCIEQRDIEAIADVDLAAQTQCRLKPEAFVNGVLRLEILEGGNVNFVSGMLRRVMFVKSCKKGVTCIVEL